MRTIKNFLITLALFLLTQFSYAQNTCVTSVAVGCGTNETGTTTGGTNTAIGTCTTAQGTGGMHWYTFTGDGNNWTFETVATAGQYDTKIWVFSGACGALVCVTGNDDGGAGTLSLVNFTPAAAVTYYVVVGGFGGNEGNYDLNINSAPCNPLPMTYLSSTTTQNNTSDITLCGAKANQEIICVEVLTTGALAPLTIQRIRLRTNGSTDPMNDINNIDIYYTGTSSTFATTTLYGNAAPNTAGNNIAINANQILAEGTNYFWVVYDVSATATVGNNLDALCNRVRINGINDDALTVGNPAGNREIHNCPGSPGGVNTNILFWVKADAGLTTAGANVTAWIDQSTASTAITVNGSPDEVAVGRNYNPIVDWTKSDGANGGDWLSTANVNVQSYFTVGQLTDITRGPTHLVTYDQVTFAGPCAQCAAHGGNTAGGIATYGANSYGNSNFQSAGVWRMNGDPTGVTNLSPHSGNFDIVGALGTGTASANTFLGGQVNSSSFNGRGRDWFGPIGEMIVYTGAITNAEANKVESYLAIKYGITLGGNGSTTLAYASSQGTSLWTANSGYHNNVIGIGRDDTESLLQKQSQTPNDTSRVYLNTLQTSNIANTGVFGTDDSYLVIGDNQGVLNANLAANAEMQIGLTGCALFSRLEREWKVTKTNIAEDFSFDVTLNALANQIAVNVAHLRLLVDDDGNFTTGGSCYYNGDGSGITITYNNPVITISGISAAHIPNNSSRFITIASINALTPLPVEFLQFEATCQNEFSELIWSTASEISNDYFTIERSADAKNFEVLARVNGNGNSNTTINYKWTDDNPINGASYYRLKQTDFNGAFKYSGIRTVSCEELDDISIYPNPFENSFTVQLSENSTYPVTVEVIDYLGRKVHSQVIENTRTKILLDDEFPSGTYFVKVISQTTQFVERMVKMK